MTDTTIEVQFFDVGTWRTYARAVPKGPVFVNRTMQELCGFCHTPNFLEHGLIDKGAPSLL
jgi:hypothetical protein